MLRLGTPSKNALNQNTMPVSQLSEMIAKKNAPRMRTPRNAREIALPVRSRACGMGSTCIDFVISKNPASSAAPANVGTGPSLGLKDSTPVRPKLAQEENATLKITLSTNLN